MASVFLSYDHEDEDRAAAIASALEKARHSVWWDRHIHGGAEYNSEIESAVEQADAVVVLWSERSVRSAWVRDEAAEGRDQAKLVPVLLDPVKPPMGFRQYQTIDLSGWKPRQRIPRLEELLRGIESVSGSAGSVARQERPASSVRAGKWQPRVPLAWFAAPVAVTGAAALLVWNPFSGGPSQAVAAVAPADTSALSDQFARDLLAKLGRLQVKADEPVEIAGADGREDADLTFEVAASKDADSTHASLILRGRAAVLWSRDFEARSAKAGDLRQQLSFAASKVLDCAAGAHEAGLGTETLRSYVNACSALELGDADDPAEIEPKLRQVAAAAPEFTDAWSQLLLVQPRPDNGAQRARLQKDIAAARSADPQLPAAYLAELKLLGPSDYDRAFEIVERGLSHNSDDPLLLAVMGEQMDGIGRSTDAANYIRTAVDRDPLSPHLRAELVFALANDGRLEAAFKELDQADRLWPGWKDLNDIRYMLHATYGDPRVARKMGEAEAYTPSWTRAVHFWEARLDPTPAKIERHVREVREAYRESPEIIGHFVTVLAMFHRDQELLDLVMRLPLADAIRIRSQLFRPYAHGFWRDPQALRFAQRVGLLQFWSRSGKWPDFCSDADLPYDCRKEATKLLGHRA